MRLPPLSMAVIGVLLSVNVWLHAEPPSRSLFNGKDLSGWLPLHGGAWQVEAGTIVGRQGTGWSTDPTKSGSWLRSARMYSDFVFELEYKINQKGNSGIFIRSGVEANPAFTGHEIQILDDHGRPPKTWTSGALYDVAAPAKNLSKPAGEWNQVRIEARGPRVVVFHNGTKIVDHQSKRARRGYLGLRNHDDHAVIRFRNLRVTDLAKPKLIRVGIIGLDTSHAPAFAKLINDPLAKPDVAGCKVVAAYPPGSPDIQSSVSRVPKYTAQLREMGVEIVDSIESLLERVDAVLLETNDGRPHLAQVRPVLRAGKPVFVDKPVAGSLRDALAIYAEAARLQGPLFSSSSLRYVPGSQRARAGAFGKILGCTTYSPCSLEATHPDLFWYGIHGVESLFTVMGAGCQSVVRTSTPNTDVVVGTWDGGRVGTFRGLRGGAGGYGGTAFGTKGIGELGKSAGYRPLVAEIVSFFHTHVAPVSAQETIEIYAFMEAADESKRRGGVPVTLAEVLQRAQSQRPSSQGKQ